MANQTLVELLKDLSDKKADPPGFCFELKCCGCKFSVQSEFIPFSKGKEGLPQKLFFVKSDDGVDPNKDWNDERKQVAEEFSDSVERQFTFCSKCEKFSCPKCWNATRNICMSCCTRIAQAAFADSSFFKGKEDIKCQKCGTVTGNVKFCPKCGNKVVPKGVCPACSHKMPEDAAFCPDCGFKV